MQMLNIRGFSLSIFLLLVFLWSFNNVVQAQDTNGRVWSLKIQPVGIAAQLHNKYKSADKPTNTEMNFTWLNGEIQLSDRESISAGIGFHHSESIRPFFRNSSNTVMLNNLEARKRTGLQVSAGYRAYLGRNKPALQGVYWGPQLNMGFARENTRKLGELEASDAHFRMVGFSMLLGHSWRIARRLQIDVSAGPMFLFQSSNSSSVGDAYPRQDPLLAYWGVFKLYQQAQENGTTHIYGIREQAQLSIGYIFVK